MVNGFLVIDKPVGLSSHDVVNRVRRILGIRKAGHTGTLDPFATGVLPIAVGEGTKAIQFLDEGLKEYRAVIRLGISTDTQDITGSVLQEQNPAGVSAELLQQQLVGLTGAISQLPPMYSAVKQGGQPLYKLARKGVAVERQPRQVMIHHFDLLAFASPLAEVRVVCSRGTYVRTLADDLGRLLGCGACLSELQRRVSGPFNLDAALSLEQLSELAAADRVTERLMLLPQLLTHLQSLEVTDDELQRLKNGVPPRQRLHELPRGLIGLWYCGQLIAVAEKDEEGHIQLKRVFN